MLKVATPLKDQIANITAWAQSINTAVSEFVEHLGDIGDELSKHESKLEKMRSEAKAEEEAWERKIAALQVKHNQFEQSLASLAARKSDILKQLDEVVGRR